MKIVLDKDIIVFFKIAITVCLVWGLVIFVLLFLSGAAIWQALIPLVAIPLMGLVFCTFIAFIFSIPNIIGKLPNNPLYLEYIKANKTSLGLFARPVWSKNKIVLANKFVIIEIDISRAEDNIFFIDITDKIKYRKRSLKVFSHKAHKNYRSFKKILQNIINYESVAEDIFYTLGKANMEYKTIKETQINTPLYLDINKCSEAELTAIPGVTIARAKHAIKMRKKQVQFLTLNQFYKAIDLEEEFIEQIKSKGNKILLSELPEYKQIEMRKEL